MKARITVFVGLMFALTGTQAAAQIAGTPHDLAEPAANNEICVYCHTPHGASTGIEAPLWNKPDGTAPGAYTTYDSSTIDGTVLAVGSVSIACLTCHDGTQARDAVINAPGRGVGLGFANGTGASTLGPIGSDVTNLGTDLTNDHPIGIQYGGFNPGGGGPIDADFNTTDLATATILGRPRWWVNTSAGATAGREKQDMILYTRDNGGTDEPFVECATCHDPHVGTFATAGLDFMRISNANSDVCLACHVK